MRNVRSTTARRSAIALLALAGLVAARPAEAQLPSAGAASLGLGDNYTALARGRNAVAWNPANLAMPGGPGFSIAFLPVRVFAGISPITTGDLLDYEGTLIPSAAKEDWLRRITEEGRQRGAFGVDVTELSMNIGRLGLQVSSTVSGTLDLGPDAAELLLFGNAGRTGDPRDFDLEGSAFDMSMTTTVALSYAQPLSLLESLLPGDFSLGATVKYTVGNFMISGADDGSYLSADPLEIGLSFPVVQSDTALTFENGSGIGLDLGAAWRGGPLSVGIVARNVINTFEWDASRLMYRPGTVVFRDSAETNMDAEPIEAAPASVRDRAAALVEDLTYQPSLAVGAALEVMPMLTLTADIRHQLGEGMEVGPATHAGVGAELRLLSFLPIRGGVTALSGGYQYAGGIGLELGIINLGLAASHRSSDLGEDGMAMLSISFGGN